MLAIYTRGLADQQERGHDAALAESRSESLLHNAIGPMQEKLHLGSDWHWGNGCTRKVVPNRHLRDGSVFKKT